jgi:hypothetical protein
MNDLGASQAEQIAECDVYGCAHRVKKRLNLAGNESEVLPSIR